MRLSEIAAGLEVVEEQRERGVAAVDDTEGSLAERLAAFEEDLPCGPAAAAAAAEAYTAGADVEEAADAAGLAPVTAARALHLLGLEGVSPLDRDAHAVVRSWLDGERSRTAARTATGADEQSFAIATFVETHEPLDEAREATEGALAPGAAAAAEEREALDETMSDVDELL